MLALLVVVALVGFYFFGGAARDRLIQAMRQRTRSLRETDRRAGATDRFPRATIPVGVGSALVVLLLLATGGFGWLLVVIPVLSLSTANVYLGGDVDDGIPRCARRVWPWALAAGKG